MPAPSSISSDTPDFSYVHEQIAAWYAKHGRHHLPWRTTTDPYHIYLSEIMLQQTQVATVLERFYYPFLERFPNLKSLADAPQEEVLKAWEGLGYYTRAANLHKAAQASSPTLPTTVEALRALPGIGKNTAHAVAAFAYHQPVPIMEANVKRILCRVFALEAPTEKALWAHAQALLDHARPFDYNQAMMDIGSSVCTKKKPLCMLCPLSSICQGKLEPEQYPKPVRKKPVPVRHKDIIVLKRGNFYFTKPRTTRFLQGLYGFIEQEQGKRMLFFGNKTLPLVKPIGHITQTYSHFRLEANIYLIPFNGTANPDAGQWETLASLKKLPLSGADSKVLGLLGGVR
jgi:A/G-specific adenine glycosylase